MSGEELKRRRNVKEMEAAHFKKSTSRAYLLGHDTDEHLNLGMKYAKKKSPVLSIAQTLAIREGRTNFLAKETKTKLPPQTMQMGQHKNSIINVLSGAKSEVKTQFGYS